jgi:ribosomal protein S18 acetylase RimI-like enzyme
MFRACFQMLWNKMPQNDINISTLTEVKIIRQDEFNYDVRNPAKTNGQYIYKLYFETPVDLGDVIVNDPTVSNFYDRNKIDVLASTAVGYITYRLVTGQICLFYVKPGYKNRGLGKQILTRVMVDMKNKGHTAGIFAITSTNHPFWSNVFNKSFEWKKRPDLSVTGSGYYLDLSKHDL